MIDLNALYSHNGLEPNILPHRIVLSNGTSRTDNTTFTEEEIADAGFTGPYEIPEFNLNTQKLIWNSETLSYSIEELPNQTTQITEELLWSRLREERNFRLSSTDWIVLEDSPFTEEKKVEWKTYRQSLRDLPSTIINITDNILWPEEPPLN